MHKQELSVALSADFDFEIKRRLIRKDGEEDLMFALWAPSYGNKRFTALIHTPVYPIDGDRQRHGNASFNPQYFERVCDIALAEKCGIAFLHSHPGPGWQGMSGDDIKAEQKIMGAVAALTDLSLVGMTVGSDGTWSARMWEHITGKQFERRWCHTVRSVGRRLQVSFNDTLVPRPVFQDLFQRTVSVWGEAGHAELARLRVGILGLGSVGSMVAEALSRMGLGRFVLIDFDEVQRHNLDRLLIATRSDIGKLKIYTAKRRIFKSSTAAQTDITAIPYSVAEEEGYRAALDCDVLFSCVDRPRARSILNHFAYAHLIPVIDGGIEVRFKGGKFSGVDWQLQTVAPGRPCLECLGAFNSGDVSTEIAGKLDDPSYLKGLPADHRLKRNENVFPFTANLATLEVMQFIALTTGIAGIADFGVQRYRYIPGIVETDTERICRPDCESVKQTGKGDQDFHLYGHDYGAAAARIRQKRGITKYFSRTRKIISKLWR
jgi:molybdopterin/thiamine biosynthesis adenylyltransferase